MNPNARHRLAGFWLMLFLLLPGGGTSLFAQATSKEYQIKAAFLFNFMQFVEWPPTVFKSADDPFRIGVLGQDPFNAALEETVQGETISNHKIIVEHAMQVDDLKNCQLIFISKSEKKRVTEILSALDDKPILTVSEIDGFAERGGGINFYLEGNKVRFEVNPDAARRDGLKVSSQLLSLGKIIETAKEAK
ncbi:MAG: YfiR family protein [Verrucomicrobiota bacterium]